MGYTIPDRQYPEAHRPTGEDLRRQLAEVDKIERNTPKHSLSDPFIFNRMRAHVRSGIFNPIKE